MWQEADNLSFGTDLHETVATEEYAYIIGGRYSNDVSVASSFFTDINVSNGSLGTWLDVSGNEAEDMLVHRYGHGSVVYNGYIYAVGGYNSSGYLNTTEYAPIESDGTIGDWQGTTSFEHSQTGRVVAYNNHLYAVGGYDGSDSLDTVQYARIFADGSLGDWVETSSLVTPADDYNDVVVYDGFVYVLGAREDTEGLTTYTRAVQYAAIHANGTLGEWQTADDFTIPRYGHRSVVYNGYIYVIGGWDSEEWVDTTEYAPILEDGSPGEWQTTTDVNVSKFEHTAVVSGGYIYVTGGDDDTGGAVEFAPIKADGSLGEWRRSEHDLSLPRYGHSSVAYNGSIYILGGYDGAYLRTAEVTEAVDLGHTYGWEEENQLWQYSWTNCPLLCGTNNSRYRTNHGSVVYNGYIYVLGGSTGASTGHSSRAQVRYASINDDGSLGGWNATTSMPGSRNLHAVTAHDGYMYVFGGADGGWNTNAWSAPINSNGSLGSWNSSANAGSGFSGTFATIQARAYNGYMYLIGSDNAGASAALFAEINGNGTVGDWQDANSSALGGSGSSWDYAGGNDRFNLQLEIAAGYVYVIGGSSVSDGGSRDDSNVTETVEYASINEDGSLGEWQYTTSLPENRAQHNGFEHQGRIYVSGGYTYSGSTETRLDSVVYAEINEDGTLTDWRTVTNLPNVIVGHGLDVSSAGHMILTGGNAGAASLHDHGPVFSGYVTNTGTGNLSDWTEESTTLGGARYWHGAAATQSHLYVVGGNDDSDTALDTVEYAPINGVGIGAWEATSSLPKPIRYGQAVIVGKHLYIVGGYSPNDGDYSDEVFYAEINPDGSLEDWQTGESMLERRGNSAVVSVGRYIYMLGGIDGDISGTVEYTEVQSDGTLSSWQYTTDLPDTIYAHSATSVGSYVYLTGGFDGATRGVVLLAEQESNGELGAWEQTASLSTPRFQHDTVAYGGYLYVVGWISGDSSNQIERAQIYNNGKLSNWENLDAPNVIDRQETVAVNGHIYVIGGVNSDETVHYDNVFTSSVDVAAQASRYSRAINFGSLSRLETFEYSSSGITDMELELGYACGSEPYNITARYPFSISGEEVALDQTSANRLYASFFSDANQSTTYPHSVNDSLTGFSVSYTPVRAKPEQRLRIGNFFSGEEQMPYDTLPASTDGLNDGCV